MASHPDWVKGPEKAGGANRQFGAARPAAMTHLSGARDSWGEDDDEFSLSEYNGKTQAKENVGIEANLDEYCRKIQSKKWGDPSGHGVVASGTQETPPSKKRLSLPSEPSTVPPDFVHKTGFMLSTILKKLNNIDARIEAFDNRLTALSDKVGFLGDAVKQVLHKVSSERPVVKPHENRDSDEGDDSVDPYIGRKRGRDWDKTEAVESSRHEQGGGEMGNGEGGGNEPPLSSPSTSSTESCNDKRDPPCSPPPIYVETIETAVPAQVGPPTLLTAPMQTVVAFGLEEEVHEEKEATTTPAPILFTSHDRVDTPPPLSHSMWGI